MQLISKAMVDGSLEALSERVDTLQRDIGRNQPADKEGNRQQRRYAAALERKEAKRKGAAACVR